MISGSVGETRAPAGEVERWADEKNSESLKKLSRAKIIDSPAAQAARISILLENLDGATTF